MLLRLFSTGFIHALETLRTSIGLDRNTASDASAFLTNIGTSFLNLFLLIEVYIA